MAFDGVQWRENAPVNADLANEIDDYMRDDKIAVRARMALEHEWPSSQVATNEAGWHTFITLSGQSAAPTLTYGTVTTQMASFWVSSANGNVIITDSAGSDTLLIKSGEGLVFVGGTGTIGDMVYITSGGAIAILEASASGLVLTAQGASTAAAWSAFGGELGAWEGGKGASSATQAATDIIVIARFTTEVTTLTSATMLTDGNATPTTIRGEIELDGNDRPAAGTITCPVKKDDYYLINTAGGTVTITSYEIPIGA